MTRLSIRETTRGRFGAAAGVVFFVLVMAAPEPRLRAESPSPEALKEFYLGHQDSFRLSLLLVGFAYAAFLVFVAVLGAELREAGRGNGVLSTLVVGAGVLVAGFYVAGLAIRSVPGLDLVEPTTDPIQVQTWSLFVGEAFDTLVEAATFWRGVLLTAFAVAVFRSGGLPRWLAWFAAVLATGSFVGPAIGWFESPVEPVGFVLGYGSYIVFHLWVAAAGIAMAVGSRR